jgi:phosphoglucomutase
MKSYRNYTNLLESRTLKGKDGVEQIGRMVEEWRTNPPKEIRGKKVLEIEDYAKGIHGLPKENVVKFKLDDGSWFCLRPSGTEPKIKFYFAVQGSSGEQAEERMNEIVDYVLSRVDQ